MATKKETIFNRSVLILGFAESVSNLGDWITMMAVFALVVFRGNGGVLASSGIMMAGLLPILVASPIAGWLCDRFDRRRLMIASELLSGALVSVLVFTSNLLVIYPILVLQGLAASIMTPARRAVVPSLVRRENLSRVNAFFQQLTGTIKIGAPLLAGGLLAIIDPHTAIAVDVLSFLVSALLLSRLPSLKPDKDDPATVPTGPVTGPDRDASIVTSTAKTASGRTSAGRNESELRSFLFGSVPLRLIFLAGFLAIFVIVGFDVLVSVFVRDVLNAGEGLFGMLVSLVGIGTVGISVYVMAGKRTRDPWKDVVLGVVLLAGIPLAFATTGFLQAGTLRTAVAVAGCLLGGVGGGLLNLQSGTLLQTLSPRPLLGRVSGAFQSTLVAGQLIGVILTPALVPGLLSMGTYFFIAFAALSALAISIVLNLRSVRASEAFALGR